MQIVSENIDKDAINVVQVVNNTNECYAIEEIKALVNGVTEVIVNYEEVHVDQLLEKRDFFVNNTDLVFVQNLSMNNSVCIFIVCLISVLA